MLLQTLRLLSENDFGTGENQRGRLIVFGPTEESRNRANVAETDNTEDEGLETLFSLGLTVALAES